MKDHAFTRPDHINFDADQRRLFWPDDTYWPPSELILAALVNHFHLKQVQFKHRHRTKESNPYSG